MISVTLPSSSSSPVSEAAAQSKRTRLNPHIDPALLKQLERLFPNKGLDELREADSALKAGGRSDLEGLLNSTAIICRKCALASEAPRRGAARTKPALSLSAGHRRSPGGRNESRLLEPDDGSAASGDLRRRVSATTFAAPKKLTPMQRRASHGPFGETSGPLLPHGTATSLVGGSPGVGDNTSEARPRGQLLRYGTEAVLRRPTSPEVMASHEV